MTTRIEFDHGDDDFIDRWLEEGGVDENKEVENKTYGLKIHETKRNAPPGKGESAAASKKLSKEEGLVKKHIEAKGWRDKRVNQMYETGKSAAISKKGGGEEEDGEEEEEERVDSRLAAAEKAARKKEKVGMRVGVVGDPIKRLLESPQRSKGPSGSEKAEQSKGKNKKKKSKGDGKKSGKEGEGQELQIEKAAKVKTEKTEVESPPRGPSSPTKKKRAEEHREDSLSPSPSPAKPTSPTRKPIQKDTKGDGQIDPPLTNASLGGEDTAAEGTVPHLTRKQRGKTKKRSKQKNIKKDNRPDHLKPNFGQLTHLFGEDFVKGGGGGGDSVEEGAGEKGKGKGKRTFSNGIEETGPHAEKGGAKRLKEENVAASSASFQGGQRTQGVTEGRSQRPDAKVRKGGGTKGAAAGLKEDAETEKATPASGGAKKEKDSRGKKDAGLKTTFLSSLIEQDIAQLAARQKRKAPKAPKVKEGFKNLR
uniref:Uncharacterized protein n=1 Tax=Chromera velia CCMP2878 TaxID=1169474 RepID=A0A0G4HBR8_9ALVE|eukprot:Cvel_25890.t1-p1 / transcript=Cvel_25890.t1 / gene=Cvel_25890 / organism=Chromera_velia_CCMP2878 / gene_product=hypothetical protein / transcript_product=hypothetical protein / location=Cvel_scaffold2990:18544-20667(-) / protein_length=477 / sequence_SO=supercontig / SO=protein_coding / is_pseudo=false